MAHSLLGILIFVITFYTFKVKMLSDNIKELEKQINNTQVKNDKLNERLKKKEPNDETWIRKELSKLGFKGKQLDDLVKKELEKG